MRYLIYRDSLKGLEIRVVPQMTLTTCLFKRSTLSKFLIKESCLCAL